MANLVCSQCGSLLSEKDNFMEDMYQCQQCGSACKRLHTAKCIGKNDFSGCGCTCGADEGSEQ